jgi:hypothetical protein
MTGKNDENGKVEIADDPLMTTGEKWLIFARLNDSGTYTILSGPFGRFSYDEKNNTVTSLNVVNEAVEKANPNMKLNLNNVGYEKIEKQIKDYLKS